MNYIVSDLNTARPDLVNIEAEQELLGALLINSKVYDKIADVICAEQFSEHLHGRIYEAISSKIAGGQEPTPVTLRDQFTTEEPIGEITVPQYLGRLAANATSLINARSYAETIVKLANRRMIISKCSEMIDEAYNLEEDLSPADLQEKALDAMYSIVTPESFGGGFVSYDDAAEKALNMASQAYARKGGLAGLSTGFKDLDRQLGGLCDSDLIIVAGRPAMGKTSLATNIAFNVASLCRRNRSNGVVAFFSLEMSDEQLVSRTIASEAKISSDRIRRGQFSEDEFKALTKVPKNNEGLPLFIDKQGGISIGQLSARARRLHRQKGLSLIVIDYLQLLTGSKRTREGRVQEVSEITTGLKALAKELNVPVVALSQLSRQVEQRPDKRPQLSDLRESGSIEQDADVVMFVYREEYYLEREKPNETGALELAEWRQRMADVAGIADIIISKQRHGPIGTISLHFDGNFAQFSDLHIGVKNGRI